MSKSSGMCLLLAFLGQVSPKQYYSPSMSRIHLAELYILTTGLGKKPSISYIQEAQEDWPLGNSIPGTSPKAVERYAMFAPGKPGNLHSLLIAIF